MMKNSVTSNAGRYSTSRMLQDYVNKIYMPLIQIHNKYYLDLNNSIKLNSWKKNMLANFSKIEIEQDESNSNDVTIDAGNKLTVKCNVKLPQGEIDNDSIVVQVYYGKFNENGVVEDINITKMELEKVVDGVSKYTADILLKEGGDVGYTFRVVPNNEMILNPMNLNLIKWVTGSQF
jgi:starch phosphorylase